jgi:DNA-binding NtrC family response regulator
MQTPATHTFLGMTAVIRSKAMLELLSLAERVGRTSAAVLITGEAWEWQRDRRPSAAPHSPRHSRPWVDVNCAALPDT